MAPARHAAAVAAANRPKPHWHGFIELERVLQWQLTCRERPGVLPLFVDGDVVSSQ
jgi:hypothetical protein